MCDGMVAFQMRALSSSSSSSTSSSSPAHRLAASVLLLLFILLPHGHALGCMRPPGVQHGYLLNQTESNRGSFPPGTVLVYGCNSGYIAESGSASIVCTTSGSWSQKLPRCIKNNVCSPPTEPENGGYRCHPTHCSPLIEGTVIEYFCDEGYALKAEYKFLTCRNGEWDRPMQISCRLTEEKEQSSPLGTPALPIVISTASSVAFILLLVVLFVLVQPKLKSFHHSRREQGVSGQASSIMVEGVQVTLPSYEEAVYGSSGPCGDSGPPPPSSPPPPAPPESRVPIVLSEGLPQGATGGHSSGRTRHHRDLDFCLPSTSSSSSFSSRRHAETVLVHQAPSSSSSSSSSWAREHPGGACAGPLPLRRDSESSDQHSLLSVTSADDFCDDIPLLKEA
ncbi:LOW QUALITY PROTEIN: sushi domain-containing protein 6 [Archocentrus centrarchus]|uniref:LOW QUALITY PROTEIN: sushi domain-containing protein 6 n=1 Tax=Archocentrus centrarchus TaxID=63155 RepID=UPI0011EA11AD|nr:LOW QUALITY PROTEIN: sushi domain-containing protein 6-like [Archocentrus centrarchus]